MANLLRKSQIFFFASIMFQVHCQQTFEGHLDRIQHQAKQATNQQNSFHTLQNLLDDSMISALDILHAMKEGITNDFSSIKQDDKPTSEKSLNFVSEMKSSNAKDLYKISGTLSDLNPESPNELGLCFADTLVYINSLRKKTMWALQMLDATGKPGPGLLNGRLMFVGDYDECVGVKASYQTGQIERKFNGRYCNGDFKLNYTGVPEFGNFMWGFCFPDSCSSTDALHLTELALSRLNFTILSFRDMQCHHKLELSAGAIAVICIIAVFSLLVIVGTSLDIVLIQHPRWQRDQTTNTDTGLETVSKTLQEPASPEANCETDRGLIVDSQPAIATYRPGIPISLLLAFSAWTNTEKILNTHQPTGTLKCVNGIRVISISWVILGHCIVIGSVVTENMKVFGERHVNRWTFQAIMNATFSVDSFFVLSGLLVAYLSLKEMKRNNGKINWLLFYVHRYLRLTPLYMICLVIFDATTPYWSDGPLYWQHGYASNDCSTWWANLLYIQNLLKLSKSCMDWSWYLAVDMQFYIVSPLIFVPLFYKPLFGYISAGIFFLATTVTPYVLTVERYYGPGVGSVKGHIPEGDRQYDLYHGPYSRMGPYVVGIMLGYMLYRMDGRRVKLHWAMNLVGWAVASALALAVIFGLYDYARVGGEQIDLQLSAFYNAFSRSVWGICVAWVIFACCTGHGGIVDIFLSWSAWVPLSRLTYAVYLIHPILIGFLAMTRETPLFLNDVNLVMIFLAVLVASFAVSLIVSLVFEAPVIGIERILLKKRKRN